MQVQTRQRSSSLDMVRFQLPQRKHPCHHGQNCQPPISLHVQHDVEELQISGRNGTHVTPHGQQLRQVSDRTRTEKDKLSLDKLSQVKLSHDKLYQEKLYQDKLYQDKLSQDKLSGQTVSRQTVLRQTVSGQTF